MLRISKFDDLFAERSYTIRTVVSEYEVQLETDPGLSIDRSEYQLNTDQNRDEARTKKSLLWLMPTKCYWKGVYFFYASIKKMELVFHGRRNGTEEKWKK